jgi:hypothetical protein
MTAPANPLIAAAQVNPAWAPASKVGHTDPLISDAKVKLRKFSYGKAEGLGDTDVDDTYTPGFGRALLTFKNAVRILVLNKHRAGPLTDTDSEFDWATKKQLGLLDTVAPPPPAPVPGWQMKPLGISVEGHMSNWDFGPTIAMLNDLKAEGLIEVQGTTYSNKTIPFQSNTGVSELVRFFLDPVLMPAGRKFILSGFSEGDIVVSRFLIRHVLPEHGIFHHRLKDLICAIEMGAPYRPVDYMGDALLVDDPPASGTGGISPEKLPVDQLQGRIVYICRTRDIYTETPQTETGEKMTSIYQVVAASDPTALFMELLAIGLNPFGELASLIGAITRGVLFLGSMQSHGGYNLEPAKQWARTKIRAAVAA